MMMKTALLLSFLAAAEAIGDALNRGDASCGNCFIIENVGGYSLRRCNTGGHPDKLPYFADQNFPSSPTNNALEQQILDNITYHGFSTATAMTINEMRTAVNNYDPSTNTNAVTTRPWRWDMMFCSSYLNEYKDGFGTAPSFSPKGTGAACVASANARAILDADNQAREMYRMFGTGNGYPFSYAMSRDPPVELRRFGTGGQGDVPTNWCGVYMKYMLCGIAFPQVVFPTDLTEVDRIAAERNTFYDGLGNQNAPLSARIVQRDTFGRIRAVKKDSCEGMFRTCNRREPKGNETNGDYVHPSMDNPRGRQVEGPEGVEEALKNEAFCKMWGRGHGMSQAGTSVLDDDETVEFENASALSFSAFFAILLLFLQVLLQ